MPIGIRNEQKVVKINIPRLRGVVKRILKALEYARYEISILLVDDERIKRINQQYLNRSGTTNVISFPFLEGEFWEINPYLLGDVVISVETALRQAKERGRASEEEINFLLIHGILHLLGYSHEKSKKEALAMEAKEKELWDSISQMKREKDVLCHN